MYEAPAPPWPFSAGSWSGVLCCSVIFTACIAWKSRTSGTLKKHMLIGIALLEKYTSKPFLTAQKLSLLIVALLTVSMRGTLIMYLEMLLHKQALGYRQRRGEREGGDRKFLRRTAIFPRFSFTWMACASRHHVQTALSVFRLSFSQFCEGVCVVVEAW